MNNNMTSSSFRAVLLAQKQDGLTRFGLLLEEQIWTKPNWNSDGRVQLAAAKLVESKFSTAVVVDNGQLLNLLFKHGIEVAKLAVIGDDNLIHPPKVLQALQGRVQWQGSKGLRTAKYSVAMAKLSKDRLTSEQKLNLLQLYKEMMSGREPTSPELEMTGSPQMWRIKLTYTRKGEDRPEQIELSHPDRATLGRMVRGFKFKHNKEWTFSKNVPGDYVKDK